MRTASPSILTRRDKIIMIGGGVLLAAAFAGVAWYGVTEYANSSARADHQKACEEDRDRLRRPPSDETYLIPQGCYAP